MTALQIQTERFILRPLRVADVSERYLGWLGDVAARRYITAAPTTQALTDLERYVGERAERDDIVFLGIFTRSDGTHIGNIKYEPVDSTAGFAIMGVLIGDPEYRGKGVTAEVLMASAQWLREHRAVKQIVLGVNTDNHAAIRAYEKAGFVVASTPYIPKPAPGHLTMVWRLP
jgi:[ribosomal protein S5]-alanine N-acetyltransferase